jgi:hypothetical protein
VSRRRTWLLAAALMCGAGVTAAVAPGGARAEREGRDEAPPPGMKARVFQLKHQDPDSVREAIQPLASGTPGMMVRENDDLRTITVRDFPENLLAIEQAIRRLDVPRPAKPDVELRIHVLLGAASPGPGQVPGDLEGVVRQLSATLSYKSYYQVAAVTQRIRVGAGAKGKGQLVLVPPAAEQSGGGHFRYSVENVSLAGAAGTPPPQVALKRFHLELDGGSLGEAEVSTGLTLRDGERVVVGTGALKNRAMVVVLSARLLK